LQDKFLTDDKIAFGISEVIYYLDNDLLKDIEIVDTPGYGSENTMDTFKTQEFVKEANVLILLTEAKDPMSKGDEHKFLEIYEDIYKVEDGSTNTNNLFVIANKVDESSKTSHKIKESIKNKIEDNWEDSLVLKDEQIFTMSAKYHYDKIHTQDSKIESENIGESDLIDFVENYATFLTKNRDKEIVKNSFKNIDDTITELNKDFKKIKEEMDIEITDIKKKRSKFETNKEEISESYTLYASAISNISRELKEELKEEIKKNLDRQKLNSPSETEQAFIRFLSNKDKKSNDATKKDAKYFDSRFKEELDKQMIVINKHIEKQSKELEEEYNISGLDKGIRVPNIPARLLNEIEFSKGFFNGILDVISFGYFVNARNYAYKMTNLWKYSKVLQKDTIYSKVLHNVDTYNNKKIKEIRRDFEIQNRDIVNSIGNKLNDIEKNITKKQKDREEYNQKMKKIESTFTKIDKLKNTIKKQETDLYN